VEDEYTPRRRLSVTLPAAIAVVLVGIIVGGVVGYTGGALFTEPVVVMPPAEVIKEELTEAELRALAEDLIASEQDKALQAQARVQTLQEELLAKQAELASLKKKKTAEGVAARTRLNEELAFLRVQLAQAEEERNELRKQLKQTLRELDFQIVQTKKFKEKAKHYKMESTTNLWGAFIANAKTKICDKGTKKRHQKCYAAVDGAMASQVRGRFTVCVDTYQSVPVLRQRQRNDTMPKYSQRLPENNKFTKKGWYILFCDPTLPEAGDADLRGDDVPTWRGTYGSPEEEAGTNNSAPDQASPPPNNRPSENNAGDDLDELDLDDFEF
jgi:hypothetical protein